jgi:hypothetical protein
MQVTFHVHHIGYVGRRLVNVSSCYVLCTRRILRVEIIIQSIVAILADMLILLTATMTIA